jgi:flavin reductase (DIM6/NTAB) family NADH-FMN oxidoreductase RutF
MIKKEFDSRPPTFNKQYDWYDEIASFSWQDFLTAIPSPLFVATSYKKNGKENACLQSWSTFVGDNGMFICLIGSVSTRGHFYETLIDRKCCVLNFPSRDI